MNKTTVSIDQETARKLDKLSKQSGVSTKDFISLSLAYFEKYGINPAEHESPVLEMEKVRKRLDQVISFIRVQERDKINPMFEAITTTEARIKNDLDTVAKKDHMQAFASALNEVFGGIKEGIQKSAQNNRERTDQENKKSADGLILLAECLEGGKDRKGLAGEMRNILGI